MPHEEKWQISKLRGDQEDNGATPYGRTSMSCVTETRKHRYEQRQIIWFRRQCGEKGRQSSKGWLESDYRGL